MVKIYFLQNPETLEIFYVGMTSKSLCTRLDNHFRHLDEVRRGTRKSNRRFEYFEKLEAKKLYPKIILLDEVEKEISSLMECMYIGLFKSWGFNLTNMTDGGNGGHTIKHFGQIAKEQYGAKLSAKLKGRKKPNGFAQNMSEKRRGANNPMGGKTKYGTILQLSSDGKIVAKFINQLEIKERGFNSSSVMGVIRRGRGTSGGYMWVLESNFENK